LHNAQTCALRGAAAGPEVQVPGAAAAEEEEEGGAFLEGLPCTAALACLAAAIFCAAALTAEMVAAWLPGAAVAGSGAAAACCRMCARAGFRPTMGEAADVG